VGAGGKAAYPHAERLLITADAGGSGSYRSRLWKLELGKPATDTDLTITVCHFRQEPASGTGSSTACSPTSR
jgi:Rhodopirellula transposase DDE domain